MIADNLSDIARAVLGMLSHTTYHAFEDYLEETFDLTPLDTATKNPNHLLDILTTWIQNHND